MAQTTPTPESQPKKSPSLMQTEMDGITSVRQFFSILFGRRKKPNK